MQEQNASINYNDRLNVCCHHDAEPNHENLHMSLSVWCHTDAAAAALCSSCDVNLGKIESEKLKELFENPAKDMTKSNYSC